MTVSNLNPLPLLAFLILSLQIQCIQDPTPTSLPFEELNEEEKRLAENALLGLKVYDELQVDLFAHEPMVINPTNIDIDERGRVWVCEAYNYRNRLTGNPVKEAGDRILILSDTDGDGQADQQKVFYQDSSLQAPIGIWVMGSKVIVSQSPYVWLLTDEDGDDKADKKEVIFQGIKGIQHDHGIHAFVFGPDGKFYFNFGNEGEQLLDSNGNPVKDKEGKEIDFNQYQQGMVFRCDRNFENIEILGQNFRNPYEVAVDSYGTMWQSDNDDDGNRGVRINYIMDYGNYGFKDEMTGDNWRVTRTNIEDSIPYRHWHLNDPGVVPNVLQTGAGSPTGLLVYEGNLLPKQFQNQLIHCDPGPNVVRSYATSSQGAGYSATINNLVEGDQDQWFRPSDVCVAPDGSLIVSDWYDPGVGGHQVGDLERGRLFRIAPKESPFHVPAMDLTTPATALQALQSPNQSTRYHAWMTLHEMGLSAEQVLLDFFQDSTQPSRMRARSLWVLSQLQGKTDTYIKLALSDSDPNIRITGIRILRQFSPNKIVETLSNYSSESDVQVLREMALSLHNQTGQQANNLWNLLANQYDGSDRWYLEALGIGAHTLWTGRMQTVFSQEKNTITSKYSDLVWRSRSEASLPYLIELASDGNQPLQDRLRYFRALDFQKDKTGRNNALLEIAQAVKPADQNEVAKIVLRQIDPDFGRNSSVTQRLIRHQLDIERGGEEYLDIIERFDIKTENKSLTSMLTADIPQEWQQQAAHLLTGNNGWPLILKSLEKGSTEDKKSILHSIQREINSDVAPVILSMVKNSALDATVREEAVYVLGSTKAGHEAVLDLLNDKALDPALSLKAIQGLNQSRDRKIQLQAAKFLNQNKSSHPDVEELIKKSGSTANGKLVFEKSCALCHQLGNMGNDFGPNLSQIGRKLPKQGQYAAILYPSAGISFGYEGITLNLKNGNSASGIIVKRTENEVLLKFPGGSTQTFATKEIESTTEMASSMMPDGLANTMTTEDLIDLVSFLIVQK